MRHVRDTGARPAAATPSRSDATRGRGRHFAEPAPRRRTGPTWSSLAPTSWPVSIGVGLAVTMATTTGLAVASGTPVPLLTGGPDGLAPVTDAETARGDLDAVRAAALIAQRDGSATFDGSASRAGAASRSGVRAAPVDAGALVVAADATLPVEKVTVEVEGAPPVLPGCDGLASGTGTNGNIPSSEMCVLWDGGAIRADAAVALARLNQHYRSVYGEDMCITDGYRSYGQQVATKAAKGYLAAPPGTSNHGWGLAVDLCPETYAGDRWSWLATHGPTYGWDNPAWARPGGSKYEPWHWEYTAAVAAKTG